MPNTIYIIYKHTNIISSKSYIGITRRNILERWQDHIKDAFSTVPSKKTKTHFQNAIIKYGTNCWKHEILCCTLNSEYADELEVLLIKEHDTVANGYNMLAGGRYHTHHNMHRDYTSTKGSNNPAKRRSTRDKISKALLGNTHSSFNGYWKTPWGYFCSMKDVSANCPYANYTMSHNVIYKYCKQSHLILTTRTARQVPLFNTNDVGKTFAELGFGYISASRGQSIEDALSAAGLLSTELSTTPNG